MKCLYTKIFGYFNEKGGGIVIFKINAHQHYIQYIYQHILFCIFQPLFCFEKDDKYVFKDGNLTCVGGIFSLWIRISKWIFITNLLIIYICTIKIFKNAFKTGFSVHNNHLKLHGQLYNSKWILCIRKTGVKYGY